MDKVFDLAVCKVDRVQGIPSEVCLCGEKKGNGKWTRKSLVSSCFSGPQFRIFTIKIKGLSCFFFFFFPLSNRSLFSSQIRVSMKNRSFKKEFR